MRFNFERGNSYLLAGKTASGKEARDVFEVLDVEGNCVKGLLDGSGKIETLVLDPLDETHTIVPRTIEEGPFRLFNIEALRHDAVVGIRNNRRERLQRVVADASAALAHFEKSIKHCG